MKKYIIHILLVLWISVFELFGQEKPDTTLLNKKLSFGYVDYWKHMNREHAGLSFGILYNSINFQNNNIKEKFGFSLRAGVTFFPAIFDFDIFYNWFKINNIYQIQVYEKCRLQRKGISTTLSVCPLPRIYRLTEIIVPYIGFGYQFSELRLEDKNNPKLSWGEIESYSKINLSSWIWKTGCCIYFGNMPFNLVIEYMQTINKDKKVNFNYINFGLNITNFGSNLFGNKYKGRNPQIYID